MKKQEEENNTGWTSYARRKYNRLYLKKTANGLLEMALSTPMISGTIHMLATRLVVKNSIEQGSEYHTRKPLEFCSADGQSLEQ